MQKPLITLREAVARGDRDGARDWVRSKLDPRRRDEEILALSADEAGALTHLLDDSTLAHLIGSIPPSLAAGLLEHLEVDRAAATLATLPPDEAVDVAQAASDERVSAVLVAMQPREAAELGRLMRWPADTAGGRMTPAFVAIAPDVRADEAVAGLRRVAAEAETITYIYVVADDDKLLGVLSLRSLVLSPPDALVGRLVDADVVAVSPTAGQEVAARLLTEHNLAALPVVDNGRLLGIITADDVADIIEEETTEDFARLGGSEPLDVPYLRASPGLLWRKRILWLLALFVAEAYTGTVLRQFEDQLEAVVALAFFIPLLIGTGGNVGSQIVTTLVRAMAIGSVAARGWGSYPARDPGPGTTSAPHREPVRGRAAILRSQN
jgi:magnesium transporter